jgi:hypothetical protein
MKIKLLVIFLISQISLAQNNLEPVNSYFDIFDFQQTYYQKIKVTLFENLSDTPIIRMLVKTSFGKEYVFQIEKDSTTNQKYSIIINEPEESAIWEILQNDENIKINTKTYKSSINNQDVNLLRMLLYSAIIKTQFRTDNMSGLDGTTYNLSVWDTGLKSAQIWSPQNRELKELIFIMENIIEKSKKEKEVILSKDLKNQIINLTKQFNKKLNHQEIEFLLKFNESILEIENQYSDLVKLNSSLSDELYEIYDEVEEDVKSQGIYYGVIDDIIMEHKQYFDVDSDGEMEDKEINLWEKKIQDDNPFLKLIEIYKSDL